MDRRKPPKTVRTENGRKRHKTMALRKFIRFGISLPYIRKTAEKGKICVKPNLSASERGDENQREREGERERKKREEGKIAD